MIFGISGTKHFVRNREVSVGEVRLYLDTEIVLISDVMYRPGSFQQNH